MVENKSSNQIIREMNKEQIDKCIKDVLNLIKESSEDMFTGEIVEKKEEELTFFALRLLTCIPSAIKPICSISEHKLTSPLTAKRAVRRLYSELEKKYGKWRKQSISSSEDNVLPPKDNGKK